MHPVGANLGIGLYILAEAATAPGCKARRISVLEKQPFAIDLLDGSGNSLPAAAALTAPLIDQHDPEAAALMSFEGPRPYRSELIAVVRRANWPGTGGSRPEAGVRKRSDPGHSSGCRALPKARVDGLFPRLLRPYGLEANSVSARCLNVGRPVDGLVGDLFGIDQSIDFDADFSRSVTISS